MTGHWQRQFGELAIRSGLIDHRGYIKALDELGKRRRQGSQVLLEQLLVDLGLMTIADIEQLHELLATGTAAVGMQPGAIGRHRLQESLGAGGMGKVHAAHDPQLERVVALKLIHEGRGPALEQKFVQEARITGRLEHPNIVPIHELGKTADGRHYFTMRRVQGRDLLAVLADQAAHRPQWIELLPVFGKICDAVAFAHSQGVIHRDLKPANIMIGAFGEVLVMDWGLAKVIGQPEETGVRERLLIDRAAQRADHASPLLTLDGAIVGTPAYMPPEQANGAVEQLDERSDIYALGAILYQILTLHPPYSGDHVWKVLAQVVDGRLVAPSQRAPTRAIPWELDSIVLKAMASVPAERYPSVVAMQRDLDAFAGGGLLTAARYTRWQRLRKWATRNRTLLLAVASVLVLLAVMTMFVQRELGREQAERRRDHILARDAVALVLTNSQGEAEAIIARWLDTEEHHNAFNETTDQRAARERLVGQLLDASSTLDRVLAAYPEDDRARWLRLQTGRLLGQLALVGGDLTLARWSYTSLVAHGYARAQLTAQLARIEQMRAAR